MIKLQKLLINPQKRQLWGWVNMMFNKLDQERIKQLDMIDVLLNGKFFQELRSEN